MDNKEILDSVEFILASGIDPSVTLESLRGDDRFTYEIESLLEAGIDPTLTLEKILVTRQLTSIPVSKDTLPESLISKLRRPTGEGVEDISVAVAKSDPELAAVIEKYKRTPTDGRVSAPTFQDPIYVETLWDLIEHLKPVSQQMPCLEASLAIVKLEEALIWLNLCLAKRAVPGLVSFDTTD
jgi:hypothetical protein